MWNCRGYKSCRNELAKHIMDYDIIILTETKCRDNNCVYFTGFKTVHSINALGSGDVAISARSQIEFKTIIGSDESPVGYDTIGIRTRNLENNLNILAVYRHPRGVVYARDLNALRRHVDIGGDAIILDHYFEWTGWVRSRWRLSPLELQWSETALLDSNSDPWKEMDPQNMSLYL
ncbi:uncharacterized protein LOC105841052 isoform X3 [Monomorium pharaonis]|uniref:uncharacterized protein LOC105841052 isoform X3 n=1 Tax=Monomorium pharaonis TaxID=307658 RepID=UPI001746FDD0|nr:uncharacterized protein LOC105841052 isoform X3 [Monomorium pharaonis]